MSADLDLDTRARDAAAAARRSVAAMAGADRRLPTGRGRALALVAAGVTITVVAALTLLRVRDEPSVLQTGPAGPSGEQLFPVAERRSPGSAPGGPIGFPVTGSRFASDGSVFALFAVGPSRELCFEIDPGARGQVLLSTCPEGDPGPPSEDPYRPLFVSDARIPSFVFGRMPADVGEVSVVLSDGKTLSPQRVTNTPIGPFYAVELPDARRPVAATGHQKGGGTVRYEL